MNRRERITAVECISDDGEVLLPLMIFKGASVQSQWFSHHNTVVWNNWHFNTSLNGWTSNEIALNWLCDVFIIHKTARRGDVWVFQMLNAHDSHTNDGFLWLHLPNKTWQVFHEPHCNHILKPLNVGVFGAWKSG